LLQLHGWRPFGPREPAAFLLPRSIRRSSEKKNVSIGRRRSRGGAGRYIEMRRTLTVSVQSGGMNVVWVNWHAILLFKHGHKGGLRQKSVRILLWSGERCWIRMSARPLSPGILARKK
jgi:hypothetical protein